MKNFFITLILRIGEYEKHTHTTVRAETEEAAQIQALRDETHNSPDREETEGEWWDDDMVYRIYRTTQLDDKEYSFVNKLLWGTK